MAIPPQSHSKPRVIQGNFQGRQPSFTVQARPASPQAAQPPHAPHVQAALHQHARPGQTTQHDQGSQPLTAQPNRIGNTFQVPTTVNLSRPGQGRPLPDTVRQKMESFFNSDFSDVRVHVGTQAPSIGAMAFTMGSQIHFAPGHYNPDTSHGQRLLGHELTHVMQQRAGRVRNPFGTGVAVVQDPGMEAEADRMGRQAAMHQAPVQAKRTAQPASAPGGRPLAAHVQAAVAQTKTTNPQAQARPLTTAGKPEVIQGRFPGGIAQLVRFHQQAGTIQPKTTGSAAQLPAALAPLPPVGGGQPLPVLVQRKMETLFGTPFSEVRIHEGPEARSIGAEAFTRGSHIYFAPGQFNPTTTQGLQLLGRELAHVVQQRAGQVKHPFGSGVAIVHDPVLETEAQRFGLQASRSIAMGPPHAAPAPATSIVQRKDIPSGGDAKQQVFGHDQVFTSKNQIVFMLPHDAAGYIDGCVDFRWDGSVNVGVQTKWRRIDSERGHVVVVTKRAKLTLRRAPKTMPRLLAKQNGTFRFDVTGDQRAELVMVARGEGFDIRASGSDLAKYTIRDTRKTIVNLKNVPGDRRTRGRGHPMMTPWFCTPRPRDESFAGRRLWEDLQHMAACFAGLPVGALYAVKDLILTIPDLLGLVYALITDFSNTISAFSIATLREALAKEYEKLNDPDPLKAGYELGWLIGYVLMDIVIGIATGGTATGAKLGAKGAQIVKKVSKILKIPQKLDKIPAAQKLKRLIKKNQVECFVAGTLIQTDQGAKGIEEVRVGDFVFGTEIEATQRREADTARCRPGYRVVGRHAHTVSVVYDLDFDGETLTVSPMHPFWVDRKGWTTVEDLGIGDAVPDLSGALVSLTTISRRVGAFRVFNIEVEDAHTYHVGRRGLLVHNKGNRFDLTRYDPKAVIERLKEIALPPGQKKKLTEIIEKGPADAKYVLEMDLDKSVKIEVRNKKGDTISETKVDKDGRIEKAGIEKKIDLRHNLPDFPATAGIRQMFMICKAHMIKYKHLSQSQLADLWKRLAKKIDENAMSKFNSFESKGTLGEIVIHGDLVHGEYTNVLVIKKDRSIWQSTRKPGVKPLGKGKKKLKDGGEGFEVNYEEGLWMKWE